MFYYLYQYFYEMFNYVGAGNQSSYLNGLLSNASFPLGSETITFKVWLALMGSIISYVVIFVLCCLFVYKIIKLVGNLIR